MIDRRAHCGTCGHLTDCVVAGCEHPLPWRVYYLDPDRFAMLGVAWWNAGRGFCRAPGAA